MLEAMSESNKEEKEDIPEGPQELFPILSVPCGAAKVRMDMKMSVDINSMLKQFMGPMVPEDMEVEDIIGPMIDMDQNKTAEEKAEDKKMLAMLKEGFTMNQEIKMNLCVNADLADGTSDMKLVMP